MIYDFVDMLNGLQCQVSAEDHCNFVIIVRYSCDAAGNLTRFLKPVSLFIVVNGDACHGRDPQSTQNSMVDLNIELSVVQSNFAACWPEWGRASGEAVTLAVTEPFDIRPALYYYLSGFALSRVISWVTFEQRTWHLCSSGLQGVSFGSRHFHRCRGRLDQ